MNVFVLGGTGSIGSAVVAELIDRGHDVTALSRLARSDAHLGCAGASPIRGDLRDPASWCAEAAAHDAVSQAAATCDDDMGAVDAAIVEALIGASCALSRPLRVIYTGGCWLYPELIEIPVYEAIARHGAWAEGPALDQQMSAAKLREAIGWPPVWADFSAVAFRAPVAPQ